jgi:hypothetical protein
MKRRNQKMTAPQAKSTVCGAMILISAHGPSVYAFPIGLYVKSALKIKTERGIRTDGRKHRKMCIVLNVAVIINLLCTKLIVLLTMETLYSFVRSAYNGQVKY